MAGARGAIECRATPRPPPGRRPPRWQCRYTSTHDATRRSRPRATTVMRTAAACPDCRGSAERDSVEWAPRLECRAVSSRLSFRDLVLVLAVVAVWGFSFVTIRWALEGGPPFAMAALRFFFAAVPAIFFVKRPAVPGPTLVAYGFAIGVLQFGLLFLGIELGMP